MLEYCFNKQVAASQQFKARMEQFGFNPDGIKRGTPTKLKLFDLIVMCAKQWHDPEVDGTDWRMAVYCLDKQYESFRRMEGH
jgi:hypothetical protein